LDSKAAFQKLSQIAGQLRFDVLPEWPLTLSDIQIAAFETLLLCLTKQSEVGQISFLSFQMVELLFFSGYFLQMVLLFLQRG
jgi:hypothetical protein